MPFVVDFQYSVQGIFVILIAPILGVYDELYSQTAFGKGSEDSATSPILSRLVFSLDRAPSLTASCICVGVGIVALVLLPHLVG